jgi:hypothetical protein
MTAAPEVDHVAGNELSLDLAVGGEFDVDPRRHDADFEAGA